MFKFEKLEVWQKAMEFSFRIHELTRKFPIKKAADSIALNISEGSIGQTNAKFRQFIGYA